MGNIKKTVLAALGWKDETKPTGFEALNAAIARLDEAAIVKEATALALSPRELESIEAVLPRIRNSQERPYEIPRIILQYCLHMEKERTAAADERQRLHKIAETREYVYRNGLPVARADEVQPSKFEIPEWEFNRRIEAYAKVKLGTYWSPHRIAEFEEEERLFRRLYTPVSSSAQPLVFKSQPQPSC